MMRPPRKRTHSLRPFVQHISELAATLPTAEELAKAKSAVDDIVSFLQRIRRSLDELPSSNSVDSVATSIQVFDRLLDAAEQNPALRVALGLAPKTARRTAASAGSEEEVRRGRVLSDELASLTVDQIRSRLVSDPSVHLSDLRALAAYLQVRYQAKSTRESLAQTLTTRIANARGYDALSSTT